MKKLVGILLVAMMVFASMPQQQSQAKMKNGTYKVQYTVINGSNSSVSYGNDYFQKPAIVTIKNGKMTGKITINHSNWIKKFKATTGGNKIVSKNSKKNQRTVKFNIKTLSSTKPMPVNVRVEIPSKNYFHNYTVRLKFGKVTKVK